jgi:tetratricopeptide (TPR) repeat protein
MNRKTSRRSKNQRTSGNPAGGGVSAAALEQRGNAAAASGRLKDAAAAYRRALRREPGNFRVLTNLGNVLAKLDRPAEARDAYAAALAVEPQSTSAISNLALLEAESGDRDKARMLYRRLLSIDPGDAEAWHDYSLIGTFQPGDPDLVELERLRARPEFGGARAMFLDFAIAKALRDLGEHDRAFMHLASANRLKRASLQYDVAAEEALVDGIIDVFDEALFAANAGAGSGDGRPIFIVGMPRSGTSLVEQILASHSRVSGMGEVNHFRDVVLGRAGAGPGVKGMSAKGRGFPEGVADLQHEDFRRLGEGYAKLLPEGPAKALRVTDKMLRNFFFVGLIHLALPKARIVHCVRDPVDTCLSCYQIHFPGGQEFTYDLTELGRYYRLYARLMNHWRTVLPGRIFDLRYEDLVAEPDSRMRELLAFSGLDWEDACRDFHKNMRPVHTASAHQVHRPIYRTAVQRWKRYEKHLGPLLEALGPLAGND